jgi:hypothetical protein
MRCFEWRIEYTYSLERYAGSRNNIPFKYSINTSRLPRATKLTVRKRGPWEFVLQYDYRVILFPRRSMSLESGWILFLLPCRNPGVCPAISEWWSSYRTPVESYFYPLFGSRQIQLHGILLSGMKHITGKTKARTFWRKLTCTRYHSCNRSHYR